MSAIVGLDDLNWVWVAVACVAAFAVGGLWYSPVLFGKAWQREVGGADGQAAMPLPKVLIVSFFTQAVAIVAVALFLGTNAGAANGACAGSIGGLIAASALATTFLYEGKSLKLWLIDAGYHVAFLTVAGWILGAWG